MQVSKVKFIIRKKKLNKKQSKNIKFNNLKKNLNFCKKISKVSYYKKKKIEQKTV